MEDWIKIIKERLDTMTNNERLELFSEYCNECGSKVTANVVMMNSIL